MESKISFEQCLRIMNINDYHCSNPCVSTKGDFIAKSPFFVN